MTGGRRWGIMTGENELVGHFVGLGGTFGASSPTSHLKNLQIPGHRRRYRAGRPLARLGRCHAHHPPPAHPPGPSWLAHQHRRSDYQPPDPPITPLSPDSWPDWPLPAAMQNSTSVFSFPNMGISSTTHRMRWAKRAINWSISVPVCARNTGLLKDGQITRSTLTMYPLPFHMLKSERHPDMSAKAVLRYPTAPGWDSTSKASWLGRFLHHYAHQRLLPGK